MKHFFFFIIIACSVLFSNKTYSQVEVRASKVDSAGLFLFLNPNFTYNLVLADLKKSYGNNLALGADIGTKLKSNWSIDVGFKFYFGGGVDTSVFNETFKHLMNEDGDFITKKGTATQAIHSSVEFRGFSFHLQGGKVIPIFKRYRNSGIWLKAGIGVTQHYMYIKNADDDEVLSLSGDYKKGYDKLTIGFSLYQFVGYVHMNRKNLFCMYGGVEFMENFSKRQRDFDFNLMQKDNSKFFEAMIGFKIGWIIPLYRHDPDKIFHYR